MKDFLPSVITWFRLDEHVRRLKIQVGLIEDTQLEDAPEDGSTYGRKDGEWEVVGSGIESLTGDFVDNTDPLNPVLDRGYKVYTALINQTTTNAPSAIVLQNTFSETPVYTRIGAGIYRLTFTSGITASNTYVTINNNSVSTKLIDVAVAVPNGINIASYDSTVHPFVTTIDGLSFVAIKVEAYL